MIDEVDLRKTKERSPTFPFISLESAIKRAQQFYTNEKRGSAPFVAAARHWGYSPNSSGAAQTVSALKNYGLLSEEGSGQGRRFKLTDLALRILLDTRPDNTERLMYMRQAALTPSIASEVNEKWGSELPSDATLNHYLVLELGFSIQTAQKAIDIIKHNHDVISSSECNTLSDNEENTSEREPTIDSNDAGTSSLANIASNVIEGNKPSSARTERVIDPDGLDITLIFSGEPTVASYEFLKDYVELRIKAIQRTVLANKDKSNNIAGSW